MAIDGAQQLAHHHITTTQAIRRFNLSFKKGIAHLLVDGDVADAAAAEKVADFMRNMKGLDRVQVGL